MPRPGVTTCTPHPGSQNPNKSGRAGAAFPLSFVESCTLPSPKDETRGGAHGEGPWADTAQQKRRRTPHNGTHADTLPTAKPSSTTLLLLPSRPPSPKKAKRHDPRPNTDHQSIIIHPIHHHFLTKRGGDSNEYEPNQWPLSPVTSSPPRGRAAAAAAFVLLRHNWVGYLVKKKNWVGY